MKAVEEPTSFHVGPDARQLLFKHCGEPSHEILHIGGLQAGLQLVHVAPHVIHPGPKRVHVQEHADDAD